MPLGYTVLNEVFSSITKTTCWASGTSWAETVKHAQSTTTTPRAQQTLRSERAELTKRLFGRIPKFLSEFSWRVEQHRPVVPYLSGFWRQGSAFFRRLPFMFLLRVDKGGVCRPPLR